MPDQPLTASISRVRLAGKDKDHRVLRIIDDLGEPLEVGKEEVRSLVGGEAATKADEQRLRGERLEEAHQHGGILIEVSHVCLVATAEVLDEATLELQSPLPDVLVGSLPDLVPEVETVLLGEDIIAHTLLHQIRPGGGHPSGQVHAIGHIPDMELLREVSLPDGSKHLARHLTVELTYTIRLLAGIECQDAHGEFLMRAGSLTTKIDQILEGDMELVGVVPDILRKEGLVEVIMSCRYRSVTGIEAGGAYQLQCLIKVETALHHMSHSLQPHKGSMTLIGMIDIGLDAEESEHLHTADAEHVLLLHAVLPVASIELMSDLTIPLRVLRNVGIHKVKLHPPHIDTPDLGRHFVAIKGHAEHQGGATVVTHQRKGEILEVLSLVLCYLLSVGGNLLVEVAVAVEEADAHHIGTEVTRLLDVVTGEDAETAGVDLQDIGDAILHTEVGDRGEVVPLRLIHIGPEAAVDLREPLEEVLILCQLCDTTLREGVEDVDRIPLGVVPDHRVEIPEEKTSRCIPHPPEIIGELLQLLK